MKKTFVLFTVLLLVFTGSWAVKAKTPNNKPSDNKEDNNDSWFNDTYDISSDSEWFLDPEIPDNYIPVVGEDELYMVVDENGAILGYRHRIKGADGSYNWEDVNPDIPTNYEATGIKDVYKVTENGQTKYYRYRRNKDNSFSFIECDSNGNYLEKDDPKDAEKIDKRHKKIEKNIYGLYDCNGVLIGFRQRIQDINGKYLWQVANDPANEGTELTNSLQNGKNKNKVIIDGGSTSNNDGTYQITDTETETVTENGKIITYETKIIKTYDQDGNLIKTQKGDRVKVKEQLLNSLKVDKKRIKETAYKEFQRIKKNGAYDKNLEKQVKSLLLLFRKEKGKKKIKFETTSDLSYIARIKSKDMCDFKSGNDKSLLYGSFEKMCSNFGVKKKFYYNIIKMPIKSAKEINLKLNNIEQFKNNRLSNITNGCISISRDENNLYYVEIFY